MVGIKIKRIGIDIGSRFVKIVIPLKAENDLRQIDTISFYKDYSRYVDNIAGLLFGPTCDKDSIYDDIEIVTTGYGKNNIRVRDGLVLTINEIHALTYGAIAQTGLSDFVLLDIGGQDTKVIEVIDGSINNFEMNDKCAAGTGRYLENIARVLGVSMEEIGNHYLNPVTLSNTCAIFAESEIIGRLSENTPVVSLLAGANLSIVNRLLPMISKVKGDTPLLLSGGVVNNIAIRRLIIQETHRDVIILPTPQFTGAIGCCFYKEDINGS